MTAPSKSRTSRRITPKGTRPNGTVAPSTVERQAGGRTTDVVHDHSWTRNDHQRPGRSNAGRDLARRSGHRGGR